MSDISRLPIRGQVEKPDQDILPQGEMRAADRDRSRTARWLIRHNHAGRLETKAFEARRAAALAARSLKELEHLTADLPAQRARRRFRWSPLTGILVRISVMVATLGAMITGSIAVWHAGNHWYNGGGQNGWFMSESAWSNGIIAGIWIAGIWLLVVQGIFAVRYYDRLP